MTPSQVGVAKVFCRRSVAPAGARPVSTECVEVSTAFSSAIRNASRLPLPAYWPAPRYSSTTSGNGGWNSFGPISKVYPNPPVALYDQSSTEPVVS